MEAGDAYHFLKLTFERYSRAPTTTDLYPMASIRGSAWFPTLEATRTRNSPPYEYEDGVYILLRVHVTIPSILSGHILMHRNLALCYEWTTMLRQDHQSSAALFYSWRAREQIL